MEERAELAGNLMAELLEVREGLRMREITQVEALQRIDTVRQRRLAGLEPQQRRYFEQLGKVKQPVEFTPVRQPLPAANPANGRHAPRDLKGDPR